MYVEENNSLKENIEKFSKKTYAEAVVAHSVEGKSAPSDAETKCEVPRTSITSLNTITLSQGVKSGNQDEKYDNVTRKESSTETHIVFLMLDSQELLRPVTVFKRDRTGTKGLSSQVTCQGVSGAPEPTRDPFIKRITKDTDDESV